MIFRCDLFYLRKGTKYEEMPAFPVYELKVEVNNGEKENMLTCDDAFDSGIFLKWM